MATAQNNYVPAVRLREPDRSQVRMIVQSPDDLIAQDHQARVIWRACQAQDRSAFCRPIKAREGVCGRDATGPTRMIATLVQKKLVEAHRISRDGTRVRACAGAASFRREARLRQLLEGAQKHVRELRAQLDDPEKSAGLSAKQKAARTRAAREREQRIELAIKRLPELKKKQEKLAKRKSRKEKERLREPRQHHRRGILGAHPTDACG
jgi:DNA repair exonuclease SbcCD ATPase subunit